MSPWRKKNGNQTLGNLRPGALAEVLDVGSAKGCTRLRELGFTPGVSVEVLSGDETLLVRLGEQRLCMRASSADEVAVQPLV